MRNRADLARIARVADIIGDSLSPALVESIGKAATRAGAGRCPAFADALGVSEQLGEVLRHVAAAVLYRRALTMTAQEALRLATLSEGLEFLKAAVAAHAARLD